MQKGFNLVRQTVSERPRQRADVAVLGRQAVTENGLSARLQTLLGILQCQIECVARLGLAPEKRLAQCHGDA